MLTVKIAILCSRSRSEIDIVYIECLTTIKR